MAATYIETTDIRDYAVTPIKAKLDTAWNFTGGLQISGSAVATEAYVDASASGLDPKESVKAKSTGTLATNADIASGLDYTSDEITAVLASSGVFGMDGVSLSDGDRVLLTHEASGLGGAANGIWSVGISGTDLTLTRPADFDSGADAGPNSFCFVEQGTVNADTGWVMTNDTEPTLGTTALVWVQFSAAGSYTGGVGLAQTGTNIYVAQTGTTLNIQANSLDVALASAGGLEDSSGVKIKLDGTSLALSSSGITVNPASNGGLEISSGLKLKVDAAGAIVLGASGAAVNVDTTTIEISTNKIQVKSGVFSAADHNHDSAYAAIGHNHDSDYADISHASGHAGPGLSVDSGESLKVNVDASTIEIATDTLQVKAGGIDTTQLADGAVTFAKTDQTVAWNFTAGQLQVGGVNVATTSDAFDGDLNGIGALTNSTGDLVLKISAGNTLSIVDDGSSEVASVSILGAGAFSALTVGGTAVSLEGHDHDLAYAAIGHNHDSEYSALGHDHDASYASISHAASHTDGTDNIAVDNSTIEIATSALAIKDAGVTFAKLASAVSGRLGGFDVREDFVGDGATTEFELSYADVKLSGGGHLVTQGGMVRKMGSGNDYTMSDDTGTGGVDVLVFETAPPNGANISIFYKRTGSSA